MIFLEKKYSAAEYRSLVEARGDGQCTDSDRQEGGRFGDGNDCQKEGSGSGDSVATVAKKAKERNVDVMLGGGRRVAVMDAESKQRAIEDFKSHPKPAGSAAGSATDLWDRDFVTREKGRVQKPKDGSEPRVSDGKIASTAPAFTSDDLRQNSQFVAHEAVGQFLSSRHEEERAKTGASGPGAIIDTAAEEIPEQQMKYVVDALAEDAIHAYDVLGVDPGFYSTDLGSTMRQMTTRHPEFASDDNARFVFTTLLAITSSGQGPDANLRDADDLYRMYREHGTVVPSSYGGGGRSAIPSLKAFQGLLDSFGPDRTRRLLSGYTTAGRIEKTLRSLAGKSKADEWRERTGSSPWSVPVDDKGKEKEMTSGELRDEVIPIAAIFGPKIGSFYANLSGRHEFLTMDRWLMRSVGRVTGELITRSTPKAAKDRAKAALAALESRSWSKSYLFGIDKSHGITKADLIRSLKIQERTGVIEENGAAFVWATAAERSHQKTPRSSGGGYGTHPDPAIHSMHQAGNSLFKSLILEQQDPKTGTARRNIREIFRRVQSEVESRTGRKADIDEIQAALWQYEKRLWKHLGAKTNITDNSLFSAAAEGVISGRLKREKPFQPASRRSSPQGEDEDESGDDFDTGAFDVEQSAWESNLADLGIDLFDLLSAIEEDVEERANFAALDVEQRDADCGRQEGGKFANGNDCQAGGTGSADEGEGIEDHQSSRTTPHGKWNISAEAKEPSSDSRLAVTHVVRLTGDNGEVKAYADVQMGGDGDTLYVDFAWVAEAHRGKGVYKSLLESLQNEYTIVSDEIHNVATPVRKAYEALGAEINRYGSYELKKKKKGESRSADCGRQEGGRFAQGNDCQEDGGGGVAVAGVAAAKPDVSWKTSNRDKSWDSRKLKTSSPIKGGERMQSVKFEGPKQITATMSEILPGKAKIDDVATIGGGAVRSGQMTVSSEKDSGEIKVELVMPVSPDKPDDWRVYSSVSVLDDGDGGFFVNYNLLDVWPPGDDAESVMNTDSLDDAMTSRVTSIMMERMADSMLAAEKLGATAAETVAVGSGEEYDKFKGYRLWPQFGFDGEINSRTESLIEEDVDAVGLSDEARDKWDSGERLTVQDIVASREGRRWWDEYGSSTPMRIDFSDKTSKGYQQFERMKRLLPKLRERNKSRSWIEASESRNCAREATGQFADGNECQEKGTGTAESQDSWREDGGTVLWDSERPPVRGELASLEVQGGRDVAKAMESVGVDSLDKVVSLGGGTARGAEVRVSAYGTHTVAVSTRIPIDPQAPQSDDPYEGAVTSSVMISRGRDGKSTLHYGSLYTPMSVSSASATKEDRLRIASLLKEHFLESLSTAEAVGISSADMAAAGDAEDKYLQGYRLWPQFGFDGEVPNLSEVPDEIVLRAAGIDIPPAGSTRIPHATVIRSLRSRVRSLTVQQLISVREGDRWWDENGTDVSLSLDLTDKTSLGYKRYQEAKKGLARLKERNKSRDWLDWLVELESRDADCGRESGRFAAGNDCQSKGSGGTQTTVGKKIDDSWKDKTGSVTWNSNDLSSSPPVAGGESLDRFHIDDVEDLRVAMNGMSGPRSLEDLAVLSGGLARGGEISISGGTSGDAPYISISSTLAIDPTDENSERVYSSVGIESSSAPRGVVVHYDEFMPDPSGRVSGSAASSRIISVMMEKMTESLTKAEQIGALRAETYAAGDSGRRSLKGYRLWPQFGFDAEISRSYSEDIREFATRAVSGKGDNPPSWAVDLLDTIESGNRVTVQQLISSREGERWWDENGSTTTMTIDFSDKKSLGYKRFEKMKSRLARLKERNKSRDWLDWLDELESRDADCGRDESGRFGGGNDCAKDGGSESPKESAKSFPKEITAGDPSLKKYVPFSPVADTKNSDFARPADDESLRAAIGAAKGSRFADKYGAPRELPQGSPVAIRIDVPTFKKSGAYAVTVHKATKGGFDPSPVGYDSVARLDGPVVFESKENDAVLVAAGLSQKFPLATVKGSLSKDRSIPDDIDDWTAVGYDPQKAAYFYDKRTGDEVTGGTDSISVGNSVFVRKPTYATNPRNAARQYRSAGFWGLESRDADCGRDESGKFGSGNKCQEDAGSTAPEKVTWSAGSGEPPFEGAEKAASVSVSGNKEVTDSLDTLGVDKSSIVDLAGAAGGSVFIRPAPDLTTKLPGGVLPVLISWDRPFGGVDYGIEGSSAVGKNDKGESILYHSTVTVDPRAKDTPAKRHAAATAFYSMMSESVQAARKAGISEVRFNASGSKVDKSWKGYTIWPRMGFDAPLPADLKAKLPETLSHAKSLLDLHATREGTQWWSENGREVDVSFRLDDPSSPQARIMSRFIKRFSTNRRDMPLGAGDGWLSPADLARFDELWEEIWDEGDLDEYEYGKA